jgi:hypothetical protein
LWSKDTPLWLYSGMCHFSYFIHCVASLEWCSLCGLVGNLHITYATPINLKNVIKAEIDVKPYAHCCYRWKQR